MNTVKVARFIGLAVVLGLIIALPGARGALAFPVVIVWMLIDPKFRKLTLSSFRPLRKSLAFGIAGGFGLVVASFLLLRPFVQVATGSSIDMSAFGAMVGNEEAAVGLMVVSMIVGPLFAEIVFRAALVGWPSEMTKLPSLLLAVLSALLFAWLHLDKGPAGALLLFFHALGFGLIYVFTGRKLSASMAAHATANACAVTLVYLGVGV